MQVGTTKDQGLYNKPSAAVHPGGISRRFPTTIQYNKEVGWAGLDWSYLASYGDGWQGPRISQILELHSRVAASVPEGQCSVEPTVRAVWGAWLGSDQVGPQCQSLMKVPYLYI